MVIRLSKQIAEKQSSKLGCRSLCIERLSERFALTAEGQSFALSQTIDTSALGGSITGSIRWGDGTSSAASVGAAPTAGPLSIRLDYSMDSSGFFASQERRNSLQFAANSIISKFSDQLTAIQPSAVNQWTAKFLNPANGSQDARSNLSITANEILVFAGARTLGAGELARGEKGGFTATSTSQAFIDTVKGRGQPGALANTATDFGPWGGTISFSSTTNFHFGLTTDGLDVNEFDFVSVASHELLHVLGFGLANSWNAKVAGGFTGANSIAVSGKSPVPLSDASHWASGTTSNGQIALMTPESTNGQRKLPTRLDFAGMQDIGWQYINQQVQVSASHTYGDNGSFPATIQLSGSTIGTLSFPFNAEITNVPPTLALQQNQNAVQGQPLSIARMGQFTDPGFGASQASPPLAESFTYSVHWGDNSPLTTGSATIETLGSVGVNTRGFFGSNHIYSQAGSFTVTTIVKDDDGGTSQQQFTVAVGPPPSLELSIDRSTVFEDAGANAATVTIKRIGFDTAAALSVLLTSSDTSELQLPSSVIIPAGQFSITVPAQAIDDTLLDGTVRVLLNASVGSILSNSVPVDVLDRETILLSLNLSNIAENAGAGAATLTVSRSNTDINQSLTVQLNSSDTSEASLPSSVVIPAGSASVNVGVVAIDDAVFDGPQSVTITAQASAYASASIPLTVTDFQPLSLVLQANELNEENAALRATQGTVSVRSPAPPGGLTLQLTSIEPSQLILPASVVIPAGSTSISFPIGAVDDFAPQGRRTVRINATGNGVSAANIDLVITDNDPAFWTNPVLPVDVNNNQEADPLDVLAIINEINLHGTRNLDPSLDRALPFVDVNRNGQIDPLDVLAVINAINASRR
ncbi:MAG: dockerin type I domain-containing protein [Planctomycetota bacterium]|nr:dockerin type I domain-containing protein [Planctomycetota bacterium]